MQANSEYTSETNKKAKRSLSIIRGYFGATIAAYLLYDTLFAIILLKYSQGIFFTISCPLFYMISALVFFSCVRALKALQIQNLDKKVIKKSYSFIIESSLWMAVVFGFGGVMLFSSGFASGLKVILALFSAIEAPFVLVLAGGFYSMRLLGSACDYVEFEESGKKYELSTELDGRSKLVSGLGPAEA